MILIVTLPNVPVGQTGEVEARGQFTRNGLPAQGFPISIQKAAADPNSGVTALCRGSCVVNSR